MLLFVDEASLYHHNMNSIMAKKTQKQTQNIRVYSVGILYCAKWYLLSGGHQSILNSFNIHWTIKYSQ